MNGDRSLLEDLFEVCNLQCFSDSRMLEGTKRDFRLKTHSLDSIVDLAWSNATERDSR